MKNVILVVLLLVSIFFLMPVGMLDFLTGGSLTPFRTFVVPAFWHAWNSQTNLRWLKKVPRPFSWFIQVFMTILAVATFWGVMIYKPLVMLFQFFIREEVLDPSVKGIPEEKTTTTAEVTGSPYKVHRRAVTGLRKFALTTGRATSRSASRTTAAIVHGFREARNRLEGFEDASDAVTDAELEEVKLQDRPESLASNQ